MTHLEKRIARNPVLYVEDSKFAVASKEWLDGLWQFAVSNGYRDPLCTEAGQDMGFMPHDHIEYDELRDSL